MNLKSAPKIMVFLSLLSFANLSARRGALLETAEALLAVAIQSENSRGYYDEPERDYYDFDDTKTISDSVRIEREVNRDVFTSMLVETDQDAFLKACDKADLLLKKWMDIEKALADDKPQAGTPDAVAATSSNSTSTNPATPPVLLAPVVSTMPSISEAKPPLSLLSFGASKPADKPSEPAKPADAPKPLFDSKDDGASGRKSLDISPPSFLDRFKKDQGAKTDDSKPKDSMPPMSLLPKIGDDKKPDSDKKPDDKTGGATTTPPATLLPIPALMPSSTPTPTATPASTPSPTPPLPLTPPLTPASTSTAAPSITPPSTSGPTPTVDSTPAGDAGGALANLRSKRLRSLGRK